VSFTCCIGRKDASLRGKGKEGGMEHDVREVTNSKILGLASSAKNVFWHYVCLSVRAPRNREIWVAQPH
jgi:hypothetical protein